MRLTEIGGPDGWENTELCDLLSRDEAVSLSFVIDCPHIFRSEYAIPSLFHLPQDKLRQVQYCFLFVFRSKEMLFAGCNIPSQFLHFIRDFCYRDERKKLQMFVYKRNGQTVAISTQTSAKISDSATLKDLPSIENMACFA